jgi:hypothetical protein
LLRKEKSIPKLGRDSRTLLLASRKRLAFGTSCYVAPKGATLAEQPSLASLESELSDSASLGYLRLSAQDKSLLRKEKSIPKLGCFFLGGEERI